MNLVYRRGHIRHSSLGYLTPNEFETANSTTTQQATLS